MSYIYKKHTVQTEVEAKVYVCDRCATELPGPELRPGVVSASRGDDVFRDAGWWVFGQPANQSRFIDLCPKCGKEVAAFVEPAAKVSR